VRFRVGEVNFEGSNPCARCSVPARDSYTGEDAVGFSKGALQRFAAANTCRPGRPAEHFDHFYRLAVNTRVVLSEVGKTLRVGHHLENCGLEHLGNRFPTRGV